MKFTNYRIQIQPTHGFTLPKGLPWIFGCQISEPNAHVLNGDPRKGAHFYYGDILPADGYVLADIPFFDMQLDIEHPTIEQEIEEAVKRQLIFKGIKRDEVIISVNVI